ncbi:putative non-specific serine/threonine protein kinase [Dioscorea sansibarensis]
MSCSNDGELGCTKSELKHALFLLPLVMKCIKLETSSSKKMLSKLHYAKTIRIAIQCAENRKLSGKIFSLFHTVKVLFSHIFEVLKDDPTFQMEYWVILRHLLAMNEYR